MYDDLSVVEVGTCGNPMCGRTIVAGKPCIPDVEGKKCCSVLCSQKAPHIRKEQACFKTSVAQISDTVRTGDMDLMDRILSK